jgi:hypothetical protein
MIDLDELRKLAKVATPGPWHFHQDDGTALDISEVCIPRPEEEDVDLSIASLLEDRDGAFIAAANPQVILELIERVREAEAERDAALARIAELERELTLLQVPEGYPKRPSARAWAAILDRANVAEARIAELEAELEVAMRPHSECERSGAEAGERIVDLEGDLARVEARIAEAAKLHRPFEWSFGYGPVKSCRGCADRGVPQEKAEWPCADAIALGLNEGENDD